MKKNALFLVGITLAWLSACGVPAPNPDTSGGMVAPVEPVNPIVTYPPIPTSNNSNEIFIPSGKQTAPDGVLEQLSWFVGGGGLTERDCNQCDVYTHDNVITAYGFDPSQNLTLIFYRRVGGSNSCGFGVGEFVTIAQIQVDANGSITLPLSGATDDNLYVNTVIDADTGHVIVPGSTKLETKCILDEPTCPGAPPQRVQTGSSAYVCTQQDRLTVRSKPQLGSHEILKLETGSSFNVIGGPKCADQFTWWKIDVNGTTGWVAEGGDEVDPYFICPIQ
ncbi:MAG: SH3 domain-containing protein [Anaerolineales bacterium]